MYRVSKTSHRRCQRDLAAGFRLAAVGNLVAARDQEKETAPAAMGPELANLDGRATGRVTLGGQGGRQTDPRMSADRANQAFDRATDDSPKIYQLVFVIATNGNSHRIGDGITASPFSPIGAITVADTTNGMATNGGSSIACRISTDQISSTMPRQCGPK